MSNIDDNAGLKDVSAVKEAQIVDRTTPEAEVDTYKGKIKVVNNITGEVLERSWSSAHEAKNIYQEIAASESAFKRAKDKVKVTLEKFMGNHDEFEFADGDRVYWTSPTRKSITYGHVAAALGEEAANLLSEINVGKLEEYMDECIAHGEMTRDEKEALLNKVVISQGKAFIKIGKAKR